MGPYGLGTIAYAAKSQYLTVDGTSDNVTLPGKTRAVTLLATSACWINIGEPGATPTAAAPGAEKTVISGFYLPADLPTDVVVPEGTDEKPVKIAAIQATAGGTLYVTYRGI